MSRTFYGAKCDIYIGTGAGKNLLTDMENAKEEIKIVSEESVEESKIDLNKTSILDK